ncbi:unnamed protein product [Protopolystoma xenopodis]|uniref:Uncharacterized protein n=1 Tax=Protopolystoma xenopodis TaxID=117903 RepID=A0A3S5BB25_9PLAT|nr:unnamed protein product [Protopolystoma xenopodis]
MTREDTLAQGQYIHANTHFSLTTHGALTVFVSFEQTLFLPPLPKLQRFSFSLFPPFLFLLPPAFSFFFPQALTPFRHPPLYPSFQPAQGSNRRLFKQPVTPWPMHDKLLSLPIDKMSA